MNEIATFDVEAQRLVQEHVGKLRQLSHTEASALPEATDTEVVVAGRRCQLTVFAQPISTGRLVVAQVARRAMAGLVSFHHEQGLVFAPDGSIRDASEHELFVSGG